VQSGDERGEQRQPALRLVQLMDDLADVEAANVTIETTMTASSKPRAGCTQTPSASASEKAAASAT